MGDLTIEELTAAVRASFDPSFKEINDRLAAIELALSKNQSEITDIQKRSSIQQLKLEELEQRERSRSIRIYNLTLTKELQSSTSRLGKYLYDAFYLPCLVAAKEQGSLDVIPPLHTVIEYCHKVGNDTTNEDGTARPAPVICRFTTRLIKYLIVTNKRTILENYNRGLVNAVRMVDDTSFAVRQSMGRIRNLEGIATVFFASQRIKFRLSSNPDRIYTVKNPLGRTIEDLTTANPLMTDD